MLKKRQADACLFFTSPLPRTKAIQVFHSVNFIQDYLQSCVQITRAHYLYCLTEALRSMHEMPQETIAGLLLFVLMSRCTLSITGDRVYFFKIVLSTLSLSIFFVQKNQS
jgi:hypothetical protein